VTLRKSVFATLLLAAWGSTSLWGQTQLRFVEYSAKFLCGLVEGAAPLTSAPVRPGIYDTSINIHNPQFFPASNLSNLTFVKKVVLSLPEGEKMIQPSAFRHDTLPADFAERVDCKLIREMLGPAGTAQFVEGYVVIIALPSRAGGPNELDVTGVYTVTASPKDQQSIALEMMAIAPRVFTFANTAEIRRLVEQLLQTPVPQ
jgi:hypothetical protein